MSENLKEIFKDPNTFAFLAYKGIEGIINGWEEYRISKKIVYSNKFLEKGVEDIIDGYLEGLPFFERTIIKKFLSRSWSDTVRFLYDILLDFGKKDDGNYKSTLEVLKDGIEKCFGSE